MARAYICFVWHMHQPFYKDLVRGEYTLPWTRMHALKDYASMVQLAEGYPGIRQTFNVVPSLLLQVQEYAEGKAKDPFLELALRPAGQLSQADKLFILRYFFQAAPRLLNRHPRYTELMQRFTDSQQDPNRALPHFAEQDLRDLQVLSQLAWFDEESLTQDPEVRSFAERGRNFTNADQQRLGELQQERLQQVLPVYKQAAERGSIELSATPFYHPILPLLCDSDIARVAMPHAQLPTRFQRPDDARWHLEQTQTYMQQTMGRSPQGLWPSEGSVSDEALTLAADAGFTWAATDNGVLARTLQREAGWHETYRPYVWRQNGREMKLIFRDHLLSDLVGFNYTSWHGEDAARNFVQRMEQGVQGILQSGADALVPVILDGENCWEFYEQNGRPFLHALYRMIQEHPVLQAVTVSEALQQVEPTPLDRIFPGSWISSDFHVWIGHEEDNQAWELLREARSAYDAVTAPEADKPLAWTSLMIAEGSDWCWWYGPEHASDNRAEFDALFRSHLANVYRALRLPVPEVLAVPIIHETSYEEWTAPYGAIRPTVDGLLGDGKEWAGAVIYRPDPRAGAMHGQRNAVQALHAGSDGQEAMYVLLELAPDLGEWRVSLSVNGCEVEVSPAENGLAVTPDGCQAAYQDVLEVRVPFVAVRASKGDHVAVRATLWQNGLPLATVPARCACEFYL